LIEPVCRVLFTYRDIAKTPCEIVVTICIPDASTQTAIAWELVVVQSYVVHGKPV
jgi:hypothetical protein